MSGNSPASAPPGRDKFDAWFDSASAERDSLTERVAELVTEVNELRAELAAAHATIANYRAERDPTAQQVREELTAPPAVVTAGTEHLAPLIRGLAIPDEEN